MTKLKCTDCGDLAHAGRALCHRHYRERLRAGTLPETWVDGSGDKHRKRPPPAAPLCKCGQPVVAHGLCRPCYGGKRQVPKVRAKRCLYCGVEIAQRSPGKGTSYCSDACVKALEATRKRQDQGMDPRQVERFLDEAVRREVLMPWERQTA